MSGLKGQIRTPQASVRSRRNADNLSASVSFIDPAGGIRLTEDGALEVVTDGVILLGPSGVALSFGNGLENVSGELRAALASTAPGLEFASGRLRVKIDPAGGVQRTGAGLRLPLSSAGDLLTRDGSQAVVLPVGADGQVLTADSGAAAGVSWQSIPEDNAIPRWRHYAIDHTQLAVADTQTDVALFTLPAGGAIEQVKMKHSTAFAGGGITALEVSVGIAGELDKYSGRFDVTQTPGGTVYSFDFLPGAEDHDNSTSIRLAAEATGDNLDQLTAGQLDVWVLWSVPSAAA